MRTPDIERELTAVLQRRAEEAMSTTDTQHELRELEARLDGPAVKERRGRTAAAAVAAAAAAAVAAGALWFTGVGDDRADGPVVDPRPAPTSAERVAQEFLTDYTSFDADLAASHLAEGAAVPEDWRRDLRRYEAWGADYRIEPCEELSTAVAGTNVSCAFSYHGFGSEELGRGPFDLNVVTLVVRDGKVRSFEVTYSPSNNSHAEQYESVSAWVVANHPDDWEFLDSHEDVTAEEMPRWLALWDKYIDQYVADMSGESTQGS